MQDPPRPDVDYRKLLRRKGENRRGLGQDRDLPPELEVPIPQLDARGWPQEQPLNYEIPERVPVRPQGERQVIVRLMWTTHEELVPARAIRWTDRHVMVLIKPLTHPQNAHELVVWLRVGDVFSTIPRRPRLGG